jgi:predicted nucleotide-binding protein with TIR-like domain
MKVFIGSSSEQKRLVEWMTDFIRKEYRTIQPVPWTAAAGWLSGEYTLESLLRFVEDTDAAILFWTADDKTLYRNTERHEPRDNLIFEAGMFIAGHGRHRTQLMEAVYGDKDERSKLSVPSDVSGVNRYKYTWVDNGDLDSSDLPNVARNVCNRLLSLGSRPRTSDRLKDLRDIPGIEEIKTFVGDWNAVNANAIAMLAGKQDAQEIDLLVTYRVVAQIRDTIEKDFKKRPDAKLRVCFANLFDDDLCEAYRRKYADRSAAQLRNALRESIELLFGPCRLVVEGDEISVTELTDPPKAEYDIRLTNQRITFSYYRVNDCSFLVPLDMKKPKVPAPLAWVIEKETSLLPYDFYLAEFNAVFKEARRVHIREYSPNLSKGPLFH